VTVRTRRRVVLCALVIAFTLPLETVLLRAISTPDASQAIRTWVSGLSTDRLETAAQFIHAYPFAYRREIARALSPTLRSGVWRRHIRIYLEAHPDLPPPAVELLHDAARLVTPEFFSAPTSEERASAKSIGDQLERLVGREEAELALYRLGPREGTFTSLEPISERAANWVRRAMVALAFNEESCECATGWGCGGGGGQTCKSSSSCTPDDDWPACGWLWTETCDGVCRTSDAS
jgi:hypothetical protein